ncbi:MAG TPA: TonB-dependent receptor, partial [Brevundimonas sp.]|nr:TonB-dependent receptor [Brevundimonas sp.]
MTHVPSGTRSVAVTGPNGQYNARGLRVGGPYTVQVDAAGVSGTREVAAIGIGDATVADVYVSQGGTQLDEVVVIGTAGGVVQTAIGPNAVFTAEDLANAPAINRDIRDVIAIDPRVYVDEAFVDAVQCGGANPRFNSLTVDGVRLNDNFGLNSSGYPTERMPFSYDAIQQVAVELAPFDVEYGNFTACNINAVTKSGGNSLSGGFFYDYSDHELTGASLEGRSVDLGEFEETRWGVNLGGPIIQDRLYFFAAYEKLDGVNFFDRSPAGGGGAEVQGLSMAQYNEILDIARTVYGFDPGGIPAPQPNEDEKLLIKLDWNISDQHRAAFTYNYNDGFNITESDRGS